MKKQRSLIILMLILLLFALALTSCSTSRKNISELRGLMLQDNLQLSRNREFYSRHNEKIKRDAFRKPVAIF
jgi:hypothetical protein